jgi:hypothetical protein
VFLWLYNNEDAITFQENTITFQYSLFIDILTEYFLLSGDKHFGFFGRPLFQAPEYLFICPYYSSNFHLHYHNQNCAGAPRCKQRGMFAPALSITAF